MKASALYEPLQLWKDFICLYYRTQFWTICREKCGNKQSKFDIICTKYLLLL